MTLAFPYLSDFVRALTGLDLPLPLPTFGLMVAVAMLAAVRVSRLEVSRLHEAGLIGLAKYKPEKGRADESYGPPQEIVGDLAVVTMLAGHVGARVFHILEYPQEFLANPWGMIFTRNGFTFFGGLIVGALAGAFYVRKRRLSIPAFCDALAPALMLAYAIGRIGCQLSGDGDWGIAANMALKPDALPAWLWAQTYDGNIVGTVIAAPGVYPTPIYEAAMSLVAFAMLWAVRKHPFRTGWLFSLYLLLSGVERLAIEQIRVNAVVPLFGRAVTQAEIISGLMIMLGLGGLALLSRQKPHPAPVARSA
jgi:phosphatidylglycerol:prolipoprotein diacylglycerol transferase